LAGVAGPSIASARAVCFGTTNEILHAAGASGLKMPAIGMSLIDTTDYKVVVVTNGFMPVVSGADSLWNASTDVGRPVYVSTSGFKPTSTKPTTGIVQRIGYATSGGIYIQPSLMLASGNEWASASGAF
jgi:hypothetical protein